MVLALVLVLVVGGDDRVGVGDGGVGGSCQSSAPSRPVSS